MCQNGHAEKKEKKAGVFCPHWICLTGMQEEPGEDFDNVLIMQPSDRHLHNPILWSRSKLPEDICVPGHGHSSLISK